MKPGLGDRKMQFCFLREMSDYATRRPPSGRGLSSSIWPSSLSHPSSSSQPPHYGGAGYSSVRATSEVRTRSKSCIIRVGTTCTVYAFSRTVQSGLPSVESIQHVSCKISQRFFKGTVVVISHDTFILCSIYVNSPFNRIL